MSTTFAERLQTIPSEILVKAITTEDLFAALVNELAARGLNPQTGKWIGFPSAALAAEMLIGGKSLAVGSNLETAKTVRARKDAAYHAQSTGEGCPMMLTVRQWRDASYHAFRRLEHEEAEAYNRLSFEEKTIFNS